MKFLNFVFFVFVSIGGTSAQSLYFPPVSGNTWETVSPSELGWCTDRIQPLYDYLGDRNTKAFMVLKDGKIALEHYFGTFTADSLWYWASAGKTLTAFTVGIAQQEGRLSLFDTVSHFLGSGWTSEPTEKEQKITVWHQLTMTSGLDDGVPDPYCTLPSCLIYKADAGTRWAYHNAPYTLLDGVIQQATGQSLNNYIALKIKAPTGMTGAFYPSGYNNVFVSKARSMARFGLLVLNRGNWNGNQIMTDTAYFRQMINTSQNLNKSYGYLWWLNGKESFMVPGLQYVFEGSLSPHAPADMISALGKNGQILNVVYSQNLVMVRMGNAPGTDEISTLLNDTIWQKFNEVICNTAGEQELVNSRHPVISPNPVLDQIVVAYDSDRYDVAIYDLAGRIVYQKHDCRQKTVLNIGEPESGIYLLTIKEKGRFTYCSKVIITGANIPR